MININTEELIEQCRKQKISAQSKVYQLFAGKLFGICIKYSKNREDAEDVLQDSFLTIFKKINQYKGKGSFEGWMKKITINTALKKYRNNNFSLELIENITVDSSEEVEWDDDISVDDLLLFIQQLPDKYRLVFNLKVLDGFDHKEIAKLLNISEGTSKSNLSRARKLLQKKIENNQEKINIGA